MHNRLSPIARGARLALGWAAVISIPAMAVAGGAAAGQEKPGPPGSRSSLPLTETERHSAISRVLAHPAVNEGAAGHRLAGIRAIAATTTGVSGETHTILTVILFDHTALETRRVAIDADTNALIANEVLTGHPQSSTEELVRCRC